MTHEYILTRDILRSNPPTRPRKPIESHQTLSQVGGVWERDYALDMVHIIASGGMRMRVCVVQYCVSHI